jgi:hypothetical protein
MNWGDWCKGAISALANGLITAITALLVLKQPPSTWELFCIAGAPCLITLLAFLKQSPPPIGVKP